MSAIWASYRRLIAPRRRSRRYNVRCALIRRDDANLRDRRRPARQSQYVGALFLLRGWEESLSWRRECLARFRRIEHRKLDSLGELRERQSLALFDGHVQRCANRGNVEREVDVRLGLRQKS